MQTIFITGASSGFGKETAKLFQAKGWNVIATMRSPEKEHELTKLENILVLELDVQDENSIKTAVQKGIEKYGKIDALLNNAGFAVMGIFETASEEQIQNQYDVNVFGMMRTTKAILPFMRTQAKGVIVNISSVAGRVGLPFASIYESSKFAVEGFSEALHFEVGNFGIKVKIIEPGSSPTNFGNARKSTDNDIADYNPFLGKFFENYPKKTAQCKTATLQEVAETIYNAVTDKRDKLRYIIGEDCQFFVDTKDGNLEENYIQAIQAFFE
ncbi:SDR family oxidoreductase [Pedobacter endophyticus]|uniref:SDR family oxidoreductase n=1 Tax=Pedobacter endophyticus TaxID=2789740 RepID=A0A7U3Q575_9SPHI|nr:SDR family oxidoreductase [Pedobacter endophyticus]QPH38687.1 SDR family oxidoreductase [Pedobacter endophyticus]